MPELSRFYGIVIRMFWVDHPPRDHEALIAIETSEIIAGGLPLGARSLVRQWVDMHRQELLEQWELARQGRPLHKIEPLP
jgi:Domain of unknown function (DUF4160)